MTNRPSLANEIDHLISLPDGELIETFHKNGYTKSDIQEILQLLKSKAEVLESEKEQIREELQQAKKEMEALKQITSTR